MSTDRDRDSGEVRMPMVLPAAFGAFLFAEAGAGPGGMPLTALSALARLGLDPWDEAGRLSRLRDPEAVGQLARSLAALPGAPLSDPTGAARKLVALLPGRLAPSPSPVRQPTGPDLPEAQRQTVRLAVVAILTVLGLLLTGYAATVAGKAPAGKPPSAVARQP